MSAYFIFDVRDIHDADGLAEYVAAVTETVESYGGRYVVRGGDFEVLEGNWKPALLVLIEFPDTEAAIAWYESPAYRPLRDLRHVAASTDTVLVAGGSSITS